VSWPSTSARDRHPLASPPFPYTTLFRSVRRADHQRRVVRRSEEDPQRRRLPAPCDAEVRHVVDVANAARTERLRGRVYWATAVQDRKSTRLNSSHVKISYAVFCLKKKTA